VCILFVAGNMHTASKEGFHPDANHAMANVHALCVVIQATRPTGQRMLVREIPSPSKDSHACTKRRSNNNLVFLPHMCDSTSHYYASSQPLL